MRAGFTISCGFSCIVEQQDAVNCSLYWLGFVVPGIVVFAAPFAIFSLVVLQCLILIVHGTLAQCHLLIARAVQVKGGSVCTTVQPLLGQTQLFMNKNHLFRVLLKLQLN